MMHTTVDIFLDLKVALTKQRNSLGVGKGGLPFLGTGLLCPLTKQTITIIYKTNTILKLYKEVTTLVLTSFNSEYY